MKAGKPHLEYVRMAVKRFLEGTGFRNPIDCVEAGVRSVGDWCDVLEDERKRAKEEFETRSE